jgi:hypothetical protein
MSQIDVSTKTLQRWYDDGVSKGAVAMTIMTDTPPTNQNSIRSTRFLAKNVDRVRLYKWLAGSSILNVH